MYILGSSIIADFFVAGFCSCKTGIFTIPGNNSKECEDPSTEQTPQSRKKTQEVCLHGV